MSRLSAVAAGMRSGLTGRLSATSGHLAGPGGVVPRLSGADGRGAAAVRGVALAQSRGDAVAEATNPKTGLGFGAGIAASFFIVGAVASQSGGDGEGSEDGGSGGGDQRDRDDDAPADQRDEKDDRSDAGSPETPLEGPLDTGLPGGFDRAMDPNGDYLPGDPTAEYTIRQLLDNGWRIRFTEPATIPGDTYMDFDRADEKGIRTMWLSTELMNLPPEELMAAIAEEIQ